MFTKKNFTLRIANPIIFDQSNFEKVKWLHSSQC